MRISSGRLGACGKRATVGTSAGTSCDGAAAGTASAGLATVGTKNGSRQCGQATSSPLSASSNPITLRQDGQYTRIMAGSVGSGGSSRQRQSAAAVGSGYCLLLLPTGLLLLPTADWLTLPSHRPAWPGALPWSCRSGGTPRRAGSSARSPAACRGTFSLFSAAHSSRDFLRLFFSSSRSTVTDCLAPPSLTGMPRRPPGMSRTTWRDSGMPSPPLYSTLSSTRARRRRMLASEGASTWLASAVISTLRRSAWRWP